MSSAWKIAQENLRKAQKKQKTQHDKRARNTVFTVIDCVFVYMPAIRSGPAYKLTRPYKGPYRETLLSIIVWLTDTRKVSMVNGHPNLYLQP